MAIAVADVILGADGTGANPVNFSSDARRSPADAIQDAEARNPATLKLLRWRSGSTTTATITLQTMGAYSDPAPYNCPKSALILSNKASAVYDEIRLGGSFASVVGGAPDNSTINFQGKQVPPNGHVSLWMQEAKLSPTTLEAAKAPAGAAESSRSRALAVIPSQERKPRQWATEAVVFTFIASDLIRHLLLFERNEVEYDGPFAWE